MTRFYLHQNLFAPARSIINKINHAIYALIAALFPCATSNFTPQRLSANKGTSPKLELVAVILRKLTSSPYIFWLTIHLELDAWEHGFQAILEQGNTEMGYINPNPLTP